MNKVILKGRLTADPQTKRVGENDTMVCDFTVAVNRRFNKDVADFINCQAWGKIAEFIKAYFSKGREILVMGELHIDKYDKDGETRYFTRVNVDEVEFCGNKKDNENTTTEETEPASDSFEVVEDDDLPFA